MTLGLVWYYTSEKHVECSFAGRVYCDEIYSDYWTRDPCFLFIHLQCLRNAGEKNNLYPGRADQSAGELSDYSSLADDGICSEAFSKT